MQKSRLDIFLVEKGFCNTRQKAQSLIMAGLVLVNGQKEDKAGKAVPPNSEIKILGDNNPYVSRGGLKLEKALSSFKVKTENRIALDIGASTGGFTDCLLQHGIQKVYAIDVGYGQLAWKIRKDNRVTVIEKTNIRYLNPEKLYSKKDSPTKTNNNYADLAVIDVSFISLTKILLPIKNILHYSNNNFEIVTLVKPQFEAERQQVEKGGIVKDPKTHQAVLKKVKEYAQTIGLIVKGETDSPIFGADGNKEFFLHFGPVAK